MIYLFRVLIFSIIVFFITDCSSSYVVYFSNGRYGRGIHKKGGYRYKKVFYGIASYYGPKFHGKKTASGEIFNQYDYTCAHRTLPFGTKLRVTNLENGKSVVVRVNDRGPFVKGRILDLSYQAAKKIGLDKTGTAKVKVEILYLPE